MNRTFYIPSFVLWQETAENTLPDVSFVPPLMRRRLTDIEKISVYLANTCAAKGQSYKSVFASRHGEWHQTLKLMKQFNEEEVMSPAHFSTSVHNAAAGLFSILTKNTAAYTSIVANENTLEAGILEAVTTPGNVLFVYAEEHAPAEYKPFLDKDIPAHGAAFFLQETPGGRKITATRATSGENKTMSYQDLCAFLNGHPTCTGQWINLQSLTA